MKIFRNNFIRCTKVFLILFCVIICVSAQKTLPDKTVLAGFEKSIEQGKFAEIERSLLDFVINNPSNAEGFAVLGKLRLRQNRLNEAKSLSNKALSLDANLLSAKINLALISFQLGEIEQSRSILNGIKETEISDDAVRLNMAQTFAIVGDCAKALSAAEKLSLKIKNADALPLRAVCYLESGDREKFDSLIPAAKNSVKRNPAIALKFAEVLSNAALHKEAVELLRSFVLIYPKNADALILLAKSEIYVKDFPNAKIHLAQAEKIHSSAAELLFVKSLLESEQGNAAESLGFLEKSLAANPNDTKIMAQLVIMAMRANYAGKAVRAAENLLKIQPENADFLYLHGAASLQNNNLQAAETSLKKFLELRPADSRGCLALGLTFAAQADKLVQAQTQLQNCITQNPNNFEAKYQLGLSYKTQGETAKAVEFLEETIKLSPDYALALRDLGAVYLQTGAENKARVVLEKSAAINPNDADTHFQLSRLYNLIGMSDLARKHLEIFQKLRNPNKNGM